MRFRVSGNSPGAFRVYLEMVASRNAIRQACGNCRLHKRTKGEYNPRMHARFTVLTVSAGLPPVTIWPGGPSGSRWAGPPPAGALSPLGGVSRQARRGRGPARCARHAMADAARDERRLRGDVAYAVRHGMRDPVFGNAGALWDWGSHRIIVTAALPGSWRASPGRCCGIVGACDDVS